MNNDDFTVLVRGGSRHCWMSMCTVWSLHSKWLSEQSNECASNFSLSLNIPLQKLFGMIQEATAMGNWWLAASSQQSAHSRITSCAEFFMKHQITQVTQPHYSPELMHCDFWLFPKLKSPLKWKRFQTISEIPENTTGQLMAMGRTLWGPEVPTLKGTEASLSCVQCFLSLVSWSINVYFSECVAGYFLDRTRMCLCVCVVGELRRPITQHWGVNLPYLIWRNRQKAWSLDGQKGILEVRSKERRMHYPGRGQGGHT